MAMAKNFTAMDSAAVVEIDPNEITLIPVRARASGSCPVQFLNFQVGGRVYVLPSSKFIQIPGLFPGQMQNATAQHTPVTGDRVLLYGSTDPIFKVCIQDLERRLMGYIREQRSRLTLPAKTLELMENGLTWFKPLFSPDYDSVFLQFGKQCCHFMEVEGSVPILAPLSTTGFLNIKLMVVVNSLVITTDGCLRLFARISQTLSRPFEPICLLSGEDCTGLPALCSGLKPAIDWAPPSEDQELVEATDLDTTTVTVPKKRSRKD